MTHKLTALKYVALLPGAGLYFLWKGRALLRTRWLYVAAGLMLLANLNLVAYNVGSSFESP